MATDPISSTTAAAAAVNAPAPPARRPYHGSCHCGLTRYIAYLALPPPPPPPPHPAALPASTSTTVAVAPPAPPPSLRIYKCNCSACHKMSFFHVRLADPPADFLLLSPLDPTAAAAGAGSSSNSSSLRDYTCAAGRLHWYFCGACGVRCFALAGAGHARDVAIEAPGPGDRDRDGTAAAAETGTGTTTTTTVVVRAWMLARETWREGPGGSYLSVNAATLDAGQAGLDLREWAERGWVAYVDKRGGGGRPRVGMPHEGGMY